MFCLFSLGLTVSVKRKPNESLIFHSFSIKVAITRVGLCSFIVSYPNLSALLWEALWAALPIRHSRAISQLTTKNLGDEWNSYENNARAHR